MQGIIEKRTEKRGPIVLTVGWLVARDQLANMLN